MLHVSGGEMMVNFKFTVHDGSDYYDRPQAMIETWEASWYLVDPKVATIENEFLRTRMTIRVEKANGDHERIRELVKNHVIESLS